MKGWERVKALYQYICFGHFVQSVNVFFFTPHPKVLLDSVLKPSFKDTACLWNSSKLSIQKQSSCSSYMLLSQCIWIFHFNCFCTPVVHGLRQSLPCILFSVPGDVLCYTMCHSTSSILGSSIRANLEKTCSLYEVMASVERLGHCWLVFYLSVALLVSPLLWKFEKWLQHELKLSADEKLWNTKLQKRTAEPVIQWKLLSVKNVKISMQRNFRIRSVFLNDLRGYLKLLPKAHRWMKGLVEWRLLLQQM